MHCDSMNFRGQRFNYNMMIMLEHPEQLNPNSSLKWLRNLEKCIVPAKSSELCADPSCKDVNNKLYSKVICKNDWEYGGKVVLKEVYCLAYSPNDHSVTDTVCWSETYLSFIVALKRTEGCTSYKTTPQTTFELQNPDNYQTRIPEPKVDKQAG